VYVYVQSDLFVNVHRNSLRLQPFYIHIHRRFVSPITLAFSLILITLVLAAFAVCYDLFLLIIEHENVGAEGGIG